MPFAVGQVQAVVSLVQPQKSLTVSGVAGTAEEIMKSNSQFRQDSKKHKDKERVILRHCKGINLHFPCSLIENLIENEHLILNYAKAVNKPKKGLSGLVSSCKKEPSSKSVMFAVLVKGSKNLIKILTNPARKAVIQKVTYVYKGKKVKQPLKRDGRFLKMISIMNRGLSKRSTEINTEISNQADDLDGETFQFVLLDKLSPPDGQNSSQQSIPTEQENVLRNGKNAQTCREVDTMKLMELSDSVGQVRINGTPMGSGFLLFDNFVLTNGHVIKDIYNHVSGQLNESVTVHFSFYDLKQPEGGSVVVEEVVIGEYYRDVSPCDWALLKLSANENLPRPLLTHLGLLPKSGEICIIGHPDGGVKKVDHCLIVPTENRTQIVERHYVEHQEQENQEHENKEHLQLITKQFFENMAISVQQHQGLTYETCFSHGSSGSPVFDKHCNVVAMHTGGYGYSSRRGDTHVIGFGYPLFDIMEHMIIHMVERGRFDVLKDILTSGCAQHDNIRINVKKLDDSRNRTMFKNVNNSVNTSDMISKDLFEFFSHVESPVPMDIN